MANLILDRLHYLIDTGLVTDDGEFLEYCVLKEMVGRLDDLGDLENWKITFVKMGELIDRQMEHIAQQGHTEPDELIYEYFESLDWGLDYNTTLPPVNTSNSKTHFTIVFDTPPGFDIPELIKETETKFNKEHSTNYSFDFNIDYNKNIFYLHVQI